MEAEDWEEEEKVRSAPRGASKTGAAKGRIQATREGQITAIGPRGCEVVPTGGNPLACKPKSGLAVGDRVMFDETGTIRRVLPRETTLSRPDPMNPRLERVIAANVDVVVMVAAIRAPVLRPGLIDRYLIAIEKGGSEALLCITKIDKMESVEELGQVEPYRRLGIRVFPVSMKTGEGVEELRGALAGKLAVLVGHSGVGKSSLMNRLKPDANAATGEISRLYQKGQHTTTASTMYTMRDGIRVIDTPGVREFGLWDLTAAEVERHFHDFDAFRPECQFADCSHTHEPVCGVRKALGRGVIAQARYECYLRLREEVS
ncbi:MAG: rsgA [Bryobacterales bacterium]|nr:rsgA [Bryobacterales bacterium]